MWPPSIQPTATVTAPMATATAATPLATTAAATTVAADIAATAVKPNPTYRAATTGSGVTFHTRKKPPAAASCSAGFILSIDGHQPARSQAARRRPDR